MAKPKHKVTAFKITGKGDELLISALTRSPRGTQVAFKSDKAKNPKGDKKARNQNIQKAIDRLLGTEE